MFNYFFSEYKRRYRIKGTKKLFKDIIKKSNIETPQEYKLRAIDNLIDLCKDPVFNLYTSEGIDWLLKMCDNGIKEHKEEKLLSKSAFSALWSIIYSLLVFITGTVADNVEVGERIYLAVLVIGIVVIFFIIIFNMIIPGVRLFANKKTQDLETLRDNLEYIKACHASDLQKSEHQDTSM